jgi:hypothetical protein
MIDGVTDMTFKQNTYGQAIIHGDDTDYDLVQSRINARKKPPTEDQIKMTKQFLKAFGIKVHTLPEFNTVAEMELWRKQQVKEKLGC